ncbi:hypothetical protein Ciccas_013978 [Cichlidogyrus casuarinus]|uniref:Uncharacterized protein n=1 Tax=Cichlidogyrus casuarinus TaxID=1844966 RepID=A0ABD2PP46_9PLAT
MYDYLTENQSFLQPRHSQFRQTTPARYYRRDSQTRNPNDRDQDLFERAFKTGRRLVQPPSECASARSSKPPIGRAFSTRVTKQESLAESSHLDDQIVPVRVHRNLSRSNTIASTVTNGSQQNGMLPLSL